MVPVGFDTPIAAIGVYWRDRIDISAEDVVVAEKIAALVGDAMRRTRQAA
jgi:hypothetical protein